MATITYIARLSCTNSQRLIEFRRAIAAATGANPIPQAIVMALAEKLDTAFVTRGVPHESGNPLICAVEVDLAEWLVELIAAEWAAAAPQLFGSPFVNRDGSPAANVEG